MSQKNFVELRNVTKRFGSNTVIDNINLTIPQGQMVHAARSFRLWQNHHFASGCRAGKTERRANFY